MLILWILLLIALIVLLNDLYLMIKRLTLLRKIKKQVKKHNGRMQYRRNPLISIFKRDGKVDISLQWQMKTIDVSVITTPFRRVRYHFNLNHKLLELIVERRAVVVSAPRSPRPGASAFDRVFTLRKYKFDLTASVDENQKYVILNPAPISVSKVDGAALTVLYDNDALIPGVKVCGLKWFIENVFDGEGQI